MENAFPHSSGPTERLCVLSVCQSVSLRFGSLFCNFVSFATILFAFTCNSVQTDSADAASVIIAHCGGGGSGGGGLRCQIECIVAQ